MPEVYADRTTPCPRCPAECSEIIAHDDGPLGWGTYVLLTCPSCGLGVVYKQEVLKGWEGAMREKEKVA